MAETVPDEDGAGAQIIVTDASMEGVRRIILHRPERLNALTDELLRALHKALVSAAEDQSVRCIVLAGSGRAFCAGQDLNDRDPRTRDAMPDLEAVQIDLYHPVIDVMRSTTKPVIAAVNGIAAGAGASLALAADLVLAARSARFIFSFAKVGLSSDAGLAWQLQKSLGSARARGLLMTGGMLTAEQSLDAGLIWQVTEDDELMSQSSALANQMATGPSQAYAGIKSAIRTAEQKTDLMIYLRREAAIQGRCGRTDDYREGVLAFLEKREAKFTGH